MVPLPKSEKKNNVGVQAFRCEMLIVAATVTAVVADLKEHRNYYRRRRQLELFAAASAQVGDERRRAICIIGFAEGGDWDRSRVLQNKGRSDCRL